MTRRVVDTSTLIFLAKIGRLELLRLGVQQVLVPSEVMAEIRAGQDEASSLVRTYIGTWMQECSVSADNVDYVQGLGRGERAVLSQAVACGVRSVAMDDLAARKAARRLGLEPIGTVGVLLAAKKLGLIDCLADEIQKLKSQGIWIDTVLEREVLREAGE